MLRGDDTMHPRLFGFRPALSLILLTAWMASKVTAWSQAPRPIPVTAIEGQRAFFAGNSMLMYMPPMLQEAAESAKVQGHVLAGRQGLGGWHVIRHWELPRKTPSFMALAAMSALSESLS